MVMVKGYGYGFLFLEHIRYIFIYGFLHTDFVHI